ncbi:MAG: hypothetical protein Q9M13_07885 [Mariprofundales bacterium]|nr:hypothetical protein [Mariprofundales bacterium]
MRRAYHRHCMPIEVMNTLIALMYSQISPNRRNSSHISSTDPHRP